MKVPDFSDSTVEEAVFVALGAASTSWDEPPSGRFDMVQAKAIGDALLKRLMRSETPEVTYAAEIFTDKPGDYRWRLLAENGRIVATSGEGYKNRDHAERMLSQIFAAGAVTLRLDPGEDG